MGACSSEEKEKINMVKRRLRSSKLKKELVADGELREVIKNIFQKFDYDNDGYLYTT